jgi:glutamate-5-semialdehyde dehydrogenase
MERELSPQAASNPLDRMSSQDRDRALGAIATALAQNYQLLLEANTLDLEAFQMRCDMSGSCVPLDWFRLTKEQINRWIAALNAIAGLPDPLRQMAGFYSPRQCYWMPLGGVGLAYEGLPEVAAMTIGMCLKTANQLTLRSSPDSAHTHGAIMQLCQETLSDCGFPADWLMSEEEGENPMQLWIAYGRPLWRSQVRASVSGAVLESAIGNCYLYWAASGALDCVREMVLESHKGEPDAVNAIEVVLVHRQHSASTLVRLWTDLRSKGFDIYGDGGMVSEFPELPLLPDDEWSRSSFRKRVAFRRVENVDDAIALINANSSGHADAIVTESYSASQQFIQQVRSTALYLNAAPRFQRCRMAEGDVVLGTTGRSGFGAIRMQSLLTPKRVIYGSC